MKHDDLLIRSAEPDDAEAVVNIFNPIIESGLYTVFDTPFTVEQEREFILRFPARGVFHLFSRPGSGASRKAKCRK